MRGIGIAAAAAALQFGGAAWGALIFFDNPGMQLPWQYSYWIGGSFIRGQGLDITLPATQSGAQTDQSLMYLRETITTSTGWGYSRVRPDYGNTVRLDGSGVIHPITTPVGFQTTARAMRLYEVGQSVGPAGLWNEWGTAAYETIGSQQPLLGTGGYVGVQLTISGATHYGWIHLVWDPSGPFKQYRPTMWAYQDSPGVPALVVVPGPAAAVPLLALGAWAGARRRRA